MASPDPGFWQQTSQWLWGLLLIPVGIVYRKADNAASREELKSAVEKMETSFETHRKEDRESFRQLFANAEEDRTVVREGFTKILQEMHASENRLRDKIEK